MSLGRALRLIVDASGAVLFGLLFAQPASADLNADAELLAARGRAPNHVFRLPPRLGERSSPLVIFLPEAVFSGLPSSCVSVAVLGPMTAHFTLRAVGATSMPELPDLPDRGVVSSLAGLAELVYCGARKTKLAALVVELRSPRAVLETIVVESATPVPPATDSLPHRDPGPLEPAPLLNTTALAPIAQRLGTREQRAAREGLRWEAPHKLTRLGAFGGSYAERVEPGCHEFDFLLDLPAHPVGSTEGRSTSEALARGESSQLSVEPELSPGQAIYERQRGEGALSHFGFCAGEAGRATFNVSFAPRQAEVWVTHARSELPAHLPDQLGAVGTAAWAALLRRHATRVGSDPIDVAMGVSGPTAMPAQIEPGACYVAGLVRLAGNAQTLAIAAQVGRAWTRNRSRDELGALIAFCAGEQRSMRVETDARGGGVVWMYSLWQTSRRPLGSSLELAP
ncbi:MAG TPA: hypothetical protein VFQ61_37425 [Polyangiaceae bacterium]|nr:hypothetical protein [Polyangiaceae bacterium]